MPVVVGKIKTIIFRVRRTECYKLAVRLYTSYDFCHLRDKDSKTIETQTGQSSSYLLYSTIQKQAFSYCFGLRVGREGGWQRMRWLDGITNSKDECAQTQGDSEGQGSLACCSPWGCKELDTTEWLNNNKKPAPQGGYGYALLFIDPPLSSCVFYFVTSDSCWGFIHPVHIAAIREGEIINKKASRLLRKAVLLLSLFSRVQLGVTPQTAAHQAPPSQGVSRQEHRSGLPFPSPVHESEKWKWSRSVVSDF